MLCVCAPPSDQESNANVLSPTVCGLGTPSARTIPSTPTTLNGVVRGWPSSVICVPAKLPLNDSVDVRGTTSRNVECVTPSLSVTFRWMRYHWSGSCSPTVGMTNDPLVTPLTDSSNGCVWFAWWKMTDHSNAEAGSVPSSGSDAEPEKLIVCPPP